MLFASKFQTSTIGYMIRMLKHVLHYLTEISVCFILTIPFLAMAQEEVPPSADQHVVRSGLSSCELSPDELKNQRQRLFDRDLQRLEAFKDPSESVRGDYTLERFEQEAETTLQKWPLAYCYITLIINTVLYVADWEERDERSRHLESIGYNEQLSAKYLQRAWQKSREPRAKELQLELELPLIKSICAAAWPAGMSQKFAIIAHGFERLDTLIDEDFDPDKGPYLHPPPPPSARNYTYPTDFSKSKDPKIREEYKQLVAEHEKQVAEFNQQMQLRQYRRCFSKDIAGRLMYLYLRQSPNPDAFPSELGAFLDKYIKDDEIRQTTRSEYFRLLPAYVHPASGSRKSSQTQRK